jgi:hypothetical protein
MDNFIPAIEMVTNVSRTSTAMWLLLSPANYGIYWGSHTEIVL